MKIVICLRSHYWKWIYWKTVGNTAVFVDTHKTCVGSFRGLQAPRKQADLLASGNPHAVLTLPELANVITGLFVVNSSLIEM